MFIGHYAVGFLGKRLAPRASLGALMAASLLADVLWPIFVLSKWEEVRIDPGNTKFTPLDFVSYPISHGLVALVGWATLFAALYFLVTQYWRGALIIWFLVLSHWVLDFVTHRADMPLHATSRLVGLGLWNSIARTMIVEGLMYLLAVWIYMRFTRAKDRVGQWVFWAFVIAMAGFYVANVFSPPPPSVRALIAGAIPFGLLPIVWTWWFDRHREVRSA